GAIIGQQVSVAGAGTITARVVERHGTLVPGLQALGLTHLFPSASTLAHAHLEDVGLTSSRTAAINAFAGAVAEGAIQLDRGSRLDRLGASGSAIPGPGPGAAPDLPPRLRGADAFPAACPPTTQCPPAALA